jgi:hypothetical protein
MEWNQATLQKLIDDQVEESLTLDYKAAGALGKADGKKAEITKDVSAMANSAGGTIIYGIKEFDAADKRHHPETIDPVKRSEFSKEWLEHVVSNIRPRIQGLVIHPVPINTDADHVAYVIEIPQSTTAHQALNLKYHKRYNFESTAMYDHEIRDILNRHQHPQINLRFEYLVEMWSSPSYVPPMVRRPDQAVIQLRVFAHNEGQVYAKYVNCSVAVPKALLGEKTAESRAVFSHEGVEYCEVNMENTIRDVMGYSMDIPKYGPSRFDPILPGLYCQLKCFKIEPDNEEVLHSEKFAIRWVAHADNAPQASGEIKLKDIPLVDLREKGAR